VRSEIVSEHTRVIIAYAGIFLLSAGITFAQTGANRDEAGSPVATAAVTEQFHIISVGGRLQPRKRIVHHVPVEGYVRSVLVEEGDRVTAGQQLFTVERRDDVTRVFKPAVVTSRIDGYVSEVNIQVEDAVDEEEQAVVVIGTEGYVMDAYISDKDAFKLNIGESVDAHSPGGGRITGELMYRSREPDYDTGLFTLTFHFPNDRETHVGEFVVIDLPVDRERGIFVRRELVTRRYGEYYLWIVNADQVLEARAVELGESYGDLVRIESGLAEGERYLTRLSGREKEGMEITSSGE
jgi:multidrug efflux pump subunit AcrA (membrane-fusion protein)